jgi:hypothetical protein
MRARKPRRAAKRNDVNEALPLCLPPIPLTDTIVTVTDCEIFGNFRD